MSVNRTRTERQRERYVRYRQRVLADPKVRESYEEGLSPLTFPLKPRRATRARRERLSIHIPQTALARRPVERLMKMGSERDESVNYLVVKAILEFLEREEKEKA